MHQRLLAPIFCIPLLISACGGNGPGVNRCATPLSYVTNPFTSGEEAIRHAAEYRADVMMGADNFTVSAVVDTASSNLVVNEKSYDFGVYTGTGKKPFDVDSGAYQSLAINAKDTMVVGCMDNIHTRFALTAKDSEAPNYLGLSYGDPRKRPNEAKTPPFFDQLVQEGKLKDIFSLALCGFLGNSRVVLGGVDEKMKPLMGNFIPIIEKTSYVVPATRMIRADNKKLVTTFPPYDPNSKAGVRTIIDSASAFMLLTPEMARNITDEIKWVANELELLHQFPDGYFRTERASSTKVVKFSSVAHLRQFPSFEITFLGADGQEKRLELSPLHYFKEIDSNDILTRVYAIRESNGDIVLGQPFLENHYTLFDRKNGRIGFGNIDIACAP